MAPHLRPAGNRAVLQHPDTLVQFRRFGHLWCLVFSSRGGAQGGISSFRAGPAFYIERGLYDCCRLCLRLLLSTWQLRLCGCKPDIPGLRPCDIPGVPDSRFGSRHSFSRENIGYAPLRVVILQCGTLRFAQAVAVSQRRFNSPVNSPV